MGPRFGTAEVVFLITLAATFWVSFLARRHARQAGDDALAGRKANRWLIGLSAGATANSGFIVTAGVGLGYAYGMQWMMLPLSWLLGDLVFWRFFPARINAFGHATHATTLSELITSGLHGKLANAISILCAVVILVCLAGYTSAQWLARQKFLSGAFQLPDYAALGLFALIIVAYSAIGGFRGSLYADTLQAVIRIVGTIIAIVAVVIAAMANPEVFAKNIEAAGSNFLNPFPTGALAGVGFVVGFAAAAMGFGLGQPQIITRYLAGSSPEETQAAKWIYISFVQGTWIAMTAFGMILRGVTPGLTDPEAGFGVFFQANVHAVITGIIAADVFATIAATSNSILIAMAQAVKHDLLLRIYPHRGHGTTLAPIVLVVGAITMIVSLIIEGTVLSLALSSVSLMGAGLAPAVIVKVLNLRHSSSSLAFGICVGLFSALAWKYTGLATYINEAGIGMACGLVANWLLGFRSGVDKQGRNSDKAVVSDNQGGRNE